MTDEAPLADDEGAEYPPAPFSFKLMIALAVLYLGWRLVEALIALWGWLTS